MRGNVPAKQDGQTPDAAGFTPGDKGVLSHHLMTEIMGTVPTFGGKKVHVGFHGSNAFCDMKLRYVNIPKLPDGRIIPTRVAREIRGFAMHEASHVIWTDQDFMENGRTEEEKKTPLLHEVWNAIEDYMIERNFLEIYPGAHKNFTATEARCCHSYMAALQNTPDMAKDLRVCGPVALTWCRSLYFGLKTPLSKDCMDTLPQSLQDRVWNWFKQIVDVESTQECFDVARRIHAEIMADPFDPNDPPADPNHDPMNQQGQQGQGQQGQGQQGQGQQGQGQQGQGQQGQGQGQQDQDGVGGGVGAAGGAYGCPLNANGGQSPQPFKVSQSLDDSLSAAGVTPDADGTRSFGVVSNTHEGPAAAQLSDPQGARASQDVLREVSGTVGTVTRIIRNALKSIARERWRGGRIEGRLDAHRLVNARMGSQEIYRKKREREAIDTAVTVLVDCSISMRRGKIGICQQLALVLQQALAGTPIQFEIVGFTSGDRDSLPDHAKLMMDAVQKQDPDAPAAARSVQLYEFKGFGASHTVASTTIGNMTNVPMGGTPTASAIYLAHERLAKRPERRHVMFVLTDGEPDDADACKAAVKAVKACNASIIGLGISGAQVGKCFDDHVQINQTSDLPAVVLNKLAGMLLGDRFKKAIKPKRTPATTASA